MKLTEAIILNEALLRADDDIDRMYNLFFAPLIRSMEREEWRTYADYQNDLRKHRTLISGERLVDEGIIRSPDLIGAIEAEPNLMVLANDVYGKGNNYQPTKVRINFNLPHHVVKLIIENNYDYGWLRDNLKGNYNNFIREITEARMKGTIHHEFAHFRDDVMHNRHITRGAEKMQKTRARESMFRSSPFSEEFSSHLEIEGQIHNIHQAKRLIPQHNWDSMRFEDLFELLPNMGVIHQTLRSRPDVFAYWKQEIKKRMAREGLLGRNMR